MPSFEAISRKLQHKEQSELAADSGRKLRAKLRGLTKKEPPREYSRGELANLSFEERMAAIGLQEVSPVHGRPEWSAPARLRSSGRDDPWHEIAAQRVADELAEAEAAELDHWRARLEPEFAAKLTAELAARQPVKTELLSPLPQPIPHRVAPGELRVVRNAVDQIAGAEADGVSMRVTERREGRIAALSITPDDGSDPFRVVARRDRAGRLIGLAVEDR